MSFKQVKIWKFLSSIKLAIWLLAIIAVLSLIGTFIPQNEDPAVYIDRYGHSGYEVLLKTGLINIYASWWFILFLILFSLNLTVCIFNRFPLKNRSLGSVISHISVLVILSGALIGMLYGQKGFIRISKEEKASSFMTQKGRRVNLGFFIRLNDFIYSENIDPKEKLLVYSGQKDAFCRMHDSSQADKRQGLVAKIPTETGTESQIADTGYKVKILRYLPDFIMDTVTKVAVSRSAKPNNPALQVELSDKNGNAKTFWIFARFPDMHQETDTHFRFIYNWAMRQPKDFISKVTVLEGGKEIMSRDIRVNEPLRFGGYTLFQSSYDNERLNWSGLQIVKDPGVPVIYAGFILLIMGLVMIFYINPLQQRR